MSSTAPGGRRGGGQRESRWLCHARVRAGSWPLQPSITCAGSCGSTKSPPRPSTAPSPRIEPAQDGSEMLRFTNLPTPLDEVAIGPIGQFDVWVGEADDTALIEVSGLGLLVSHVTQ